jgi:molybdenum cofactor cytidylyltransferase
MKFGPTPIERAEGKILGHNIAGNDGRRLLRKGKPLTADQLELLREIGRNVVYVAELEVGDVDENSAALRVGRAVMGAGLRLTGPSTGRVNIRASSSGVLRVDASRLPRLNGCEGVTFATLRGHTAVKSGKIVGTVKVIPFAVAGAIVDQVEAIAAEGESLIRVDALSPRRVDLILCGSPSAKQRIVDSFIPPLRTRIETLGSKIQSVDFLPLEDEQGEVNLAHLLTAKVKSNSELIVLAGETAIMDRHDIAPRAIGAAGGTVTCYGAPVDPGNLLMLATIGNVPVLGAPGCARSPKANIIDWVLPRLLVGD